MSFLSGIKAAASDAYGMVMAASKAVDDLVEVPFERQLEAAGAKVVGTTADFVKGQIDYIDKHPEILLMTAPVVGVGLLVTGKVSPRVKLM